MPMDARKQNGGCSGRHLFPLTFCRVAYRPREYVTPRASLRGAWRLGIFLGADSSSSTALARGVPGLFQVYLPSLFKAFPEQPSQSILFKSRPLQHSIF